MRAMGRNISKTKLACFQVKHKTIFELQEKQVHLQETVNQLQAELAKVKNQKQDNDLFSGENSAVRSVNKRSQPRCLLVDWADEAGNVAEGRIISTDPDDIVNDSRLGPTDVKVLVDAATVPLIFLWRPVNKLHTIEDAVGQMIAWPKNRCVELGQGLQPEDLGPLGSKTNSLNKCKLLDLSDDDLVVAEGCWLTQHPHALVNGLPLGPKAVKVFLDVVHEPETFVWRPMLELACFGSFVSWPAKKVVFENPQDGTVQKSNSHNTASTELSPRGNATDSVLKTATKNLKSHSETSIAKSAKSGSTSSKSPTEKSPATSLRKHGYEAIHANHKCKLMDLSGRKHVVAKGRVNSTDPDQMVHFVRLGPYAARVWVDAVLVDDAAVLVDDAAVWRVIDEIDYMKDAHGSSIVWPMDKLVIF